MSLIPQVIDSEDREVLRVMGGALIAVLLVSILVLWSAMMLGIATRIFVAFASGTN